MRKCTCKCGFAVLTEVPENRFEPCITSVFEREFEKVSKGLSGTRLVARRYASALIDMAEDAKSVEKVEKDLSDLAAMIESSDDLKRLIANPLVTRAQHAEGILAIANKAKLQKLTTNFLGVLAENRRLPVLPQVIEEVERTLRERRGEIEAQVQTAYALTPAQTNKLQKELSKSIGANVTLKVEVDESLLGGLIVTVGSQMFDDSVKRKLERLGRAMGANENKSGLREAV